MSSQSPTANKKWYEDDDLTVTENTNTKEAQRQSEFGPGVIGTEFNAIKVKLQETYEVGILKIFIETEVLKSGSNEFEPGLKELYNPEKMTKPIDIGKELLFTSDVEFSEAGFLPGSLQDDRRKYFLDPLAFNKYLLRLPKPISDIETPVKEKTDSNAYKYLQVLGNEESKRILMICENFKRQNDKNKQENDNAIIKLQKELDDAIKLVVDANMSQAAKTKLQEDIERKLKYEKNKKIKLETKYKNYKVACKILSSVVRRMQYDAMLVESYPETVKDGKSLSTTIVDWFKYKQNNPNFFKEVLTIFKPMLSSNAQKDKDKISDNIQQVVRSLSSIFQPIIESYFYDKLTHDLIPIMPLAVEVDDEQLLRDFIRPANRINDPVKYSWNNISSALKRISEITFTVAQKDAGDKLYFISKFMVNFQSDILRIFTFNKKDGGIEKMIEEITASDSYLNTGNVVNMLYHNIVYFRAMLDKIILTIEREYYVQPMAVPPVVVGGLVAGLAGLVPPLLLAQEVPNFLERLKALRQVVDALETPVHNFGLTVATNSYKTILGEASHAAFVESIFSEKSPPISYANRNNKFLVVSDFITDEFNNDNVAITIPDNYYDLETLGSTIEKELCDKCKWKLDANVPNQNRDMIWSCNYDENKKMQLKLYFPQNDLMKDTNIIPNIHDAYPVGFIRPGSPGPPVVNPSPAFPIGANNTFQVSNGYIIGLQTLTIPHGEYRNIQHLLGVMAKTINDFIEEASDINRGYKTKMAITLDAANRVKFEFKSTNAEKLRLAVNEIAAARAALAAAVGTLAIARANTVLGVKVADEVRIRRLYSNTVNEVLDVTLNNVELSRILGSIPAGPFVPPVAYTFHSEGPIGIAPAPSDEFTMGFPYRFPEDSKSVQIKTRMQIDGDEYDASTMFGVPSSVAPVGIITIIPEITIRELALSKGENNQNKLKVNELLDDYLGFSSLPAPLGPLQLERISDYGILNFTDGAGFRVTVAGQLAAITLDAVDLSKIINKANNDNRAKLKTELVEKTGLYINNSLLEAKVPVITYTDILNSLFYRYPCIPSDNIVEGTPEFDKFIEERVNVSKFKEIVWLGKGIDDSSEPLSLTIRKALDKTLMYDDCDEERSKLMCDLHYAICGPVFTNTALKQQNQYGETDELEMFYQFQLEINRPYIKLTGVPNAQFSRPIVKPFTVKGITPYYDAVNKRYKYLIYGHYLNYMNPVRQVGCVKYYDPGTKIGPQETSMQLYDILIFSFAVPGPTTVNSVVEVNFNKDDESFVYPVFQISGDFNQITQLDGYGLRMFGAVPFAQRGNVVWTPGKNGLGLPFNDVHAIYDMAQPPVVAELVRIVANPLIQSNSFNNIWNVRRVIPVPPPANTSNRIGLLVQDEPFIYDLYRPALATSKFLLNTYTETCPKYIIVNSLQIAAAAPLVAGPLTNVGTRIFLPYISAGPPPLLVQNEILIPAALPRPQISCGAVSINKDVFNITKKIHFYQREYLVEIASIPAAAIVPSPRLADIQNKINDLFNKLNQLAAPPPALTGLKVTNPRIVSNMLWIGLERICVTPAGVVQREILSCSIMNHFNGPAVAPDVQPVDLPITFLAGDFIEKIKVDINDPEIVTVFGRFTATIQDRYDGRGVKTIQNAMVIYTNLGNRYNNNENFGAVATSVGPPALPVIRPLYSLEYDNFEPITINSLPEFQAYYSCIDGLIVASNHGGGTKTQNMGTLLVKKNQAATPVVIGFHDHKITELTQYNDAGGDIWSSILCYDYNMCADIIQYDETTNPANPTTVIDKGLFNPLSFNAFKTTLKDVDVVVVPAAPTFAFPQPNYVYTRNQQRITELFNGEFVLVASKQSRPTNSLSKLHVLNSWGINLSNDSTPFYKRIEEGGDVNMTIYEMYINKMVDTIIGSAKKYYEDKIKNSLYDENYGVITNPNPPPPDVRFRRRGADNVVITGGGRREDAVAMIIAKQVELEEMKKLQRYNKNNGMRKIESTIEIRVPDMMMSDAYLRALSSGDKNKARKCFFDALCKYSKKLEEKAGEENIKSSKTNRERGNVVIEDVYKVVLCSSKLKEFKFNNMYDDKKSADKSIKSVLTLSENLYDYDEETDEVKNVILVNEWNERGFIGDYGAFASEKSSSSLTPNQMIISKTKKANPPGAVNQVVEFIPKTANSSFLLNPFITYGSFDSRRWTGIHSLDEKEDKVKAGVVQVGGGTREDELRLLQKLQLLRQQQQRSQYDALFGYGYGNDPLSDYEDGIMQRKVLEKTNASSLMLNEDRTRILMRPDSKVKRVLLWLCNFREGKMLMEKTSVGPNIILSLPRQKQFTGADNASGYALLQELCRRYFQTEAVLTKWTLEHTYIYPSTGTGIFIYNAKASELPKAKTNTVYVSMSAVYKFATATATEESKNHASIFNSDKSIIVEIFKVVKLITGGIISSTSKEFNNILATLRSKTVPPHLRSIISVTKRTNNVEANVNFLIKLFFSPNNLFLVRGYTPYYIYSSQRNHKIYSIMKQPKYDDDSYLTCLKLFLQTESDFKNKDKTNNFRVGCAVKKKLITDNFSAVWDNFWGDLIESEEESKLEDQFLADLEGEGEEGEGKEGEGKEGEVKEGEEGKDDKESSTVCLKLAMQSGKLMYDLPNDWNVSKYWPIKYNNVYYNIRANEKHKFNNEFFYDLDSTQLEKHQRVPLAANDSYLGFKCMAYYRNGNNPVLFLGDMGASANPRRPGRVYKLELNTHKLTKFIQTENDRNVLCMDILDVEGEVGYMLVGGSFSQITTYRYDSVTNDVVAVQPVPKQTIVNAVMINLETYDIITLYDDTLVNPFLPLAGVVAVGSSQVQKVCICQTKKIVKAKGGAQDENVEGYIAMIGGIFRTFNIPNDNNPNAPPPADYFESIENIGCVLIRKNPNNLNNPNIEARLVAVDSKLSKLGMGFESRIVNTIPVNFSVSSIVCQENVNKSETVFFVGGRFNEYTAIDYVAYEAAKAAAAAAVPPVLPGRPNAVNPAPTCNGIIKLTLKLEYDADDTVSKYNQASVIEPIDVNAAGNADAIVFASLQYGIINSKMYLFCLTAFLNPPPANTVYTRLNIFDIESKLNVIQTPNVLNVLVPPIAPPPPPLLANYNNQTLLLTENAVDKENIQNVLIMTITTSQNPPFLNYTFTCNVSTLNKNVAAAIEVVSALSNASRDIERDNIITDMFYMKNTHQVYIAHQNVLINNPTGTEYPLTVRSNYQEIGEWNLDSKSKDADDENVKFNDFIDKVIEMRQIFKFNPSMILFLQDVDFRNYNSEITKKRLEKMRDDLIREALVTGRAAAAVPPPNTVAMNISGFGWFTAANVNIINIDSPCNYVDKKIKNIMDFIYAFKNPEVLLISAALPGGPLTTNAIARKMYDFINDLLFMLVYTGCYKLAELVCNDYVNLVITPPVVAPLVYMVLNIVTWRQRLEVVLGQNAEIQTFIDNIAKKAKIYKEKTRTTPDIRYEFKICSDSATQHTGVAHLMYNYNQNLNSLITLKNQNNLKNKIYEYGKASFFSDNNTFHTNYVTDTVNTIEQIDFCSFYKFDRRSTIAPNRVFDDIGNAESETVYVSVDIYGNGINSSKVFEFLNIIRQYFMSLKRGVIVDIGISGPIKRLIFGGDFGCNLLHDVEVCRKFESNKMKIYTRRENRDAFNDDEDDEDDEEGTNQIFMIDVDLETAQVGGSSGDNNNQKRICIGARIEENHRVVSNKRKTRRKVHLMLSSS